MKSIYLDSVLHIWNSIGADEKLRVKKEALDKYGGSYTIEQFLDHLHKEYSIRFSAYVLPSLPERKAITFEV